jgi:hypothetical protein
MILDEGILVQMKAEDFEKYKKRKLKIVTKKEMEIAGKKGNEFQGIIFVLYLAKHSPNLPLFIGFLDESISQNLNPHYLNDLIVRIDIYNILRIEID